MRIGTRIFIVGAIPIAIAAGIALAAILLLLEVNRARSGAVLAGTVYRTMLSAIVARNDYLNDTQNDRVVHEQKFFDLTTQARDELARLRTIARGDRLTGDADATLSHYVEDMVKLTGVTLKGDRMVDTMGARAATLIRLTDEARERQHSSNGDIVASLGESDAKLRASSDIVDAAYATRLALASIQSEVLKLETLTEPDARQQSQRTLSFDGLRLTEMADRLIGLQSHRTIEISGSTSFNRDIAPKIAFVTASLDRGDDLDAAHRATLQELAQWSERILKIYAADYRSLHEKTAQLLTYSVQAHDTELATQNIAIDILKLSNHSASALSRRNEEDSKTILEQSKGLSESMASLPISPLIQTEMIDALDQWREGLRNATAGIRQESDLIKDMDGAAADMIEAARSLDASLSANAEATARSIGAILIFGAATGVLLGGGVAYVVARSITTPLANLKARITAMAQDQATGGLIDDATRRDELGDIARATNIFLVEIARRERVIRKSKDLADVTLDTLRRTQAELIQAEKLASLGQLVAGVAHEINTPIGIALTTSTVVEEEARQFRAATREGKISRSALDRLVERVSEGAGLLTINLTRAADLIESFKHVAADQVSGDQREFQVETFLHRLLTSLGPMLRRAGHQISMDCPPTLFLDSHPGALAQVITNLVVNASIHAFAQGQVGAITVMAEATGTDTVRFTIGDNGRGISPDHRAKIFDPFFTTRRAQGSTGLGLHIVFNLVTSTLQGRINLDSIPGKGTRFTLDLPRVASPARTLISEPETLS